MTTLQKIAKQIVARVHAVYGDNPKATSSKKFQEEVFNYWMGAMLALQAIDHPNTEHVQRVVAMVISVRGWSETLIIANRPVKTEA